jgi:LmbE family N-acetylglucosaminyl deacetylase
MIGLTFAETSAPPRVLVLGAHADDVEIGCGGTLLRLLEARPGTRVHYAVFSSNAQREAEARGAAADLLAGAGEAQVDVGSFRESFFPYEGRAIKERFEELKPFAPDVVLTHRTADLHQDHRTLGELTWNTFRNHLILEYEIPKYEGDLGQPNCYVPLTRAQAQRKIEIIVRHYRSQATRTWFKPETFEALMRLRGIECNAPEGYAEAFHVRKFVL